MLGFTALGRAEPLLFLAVRPWVLLLAALCAAAWPWRERFGLYAAALTLAAAAETILVLALGAADPWPGLLRGLAAGLLVALIADAIVQILTRWHRWLGRAAALLLLGGLIFLWSGTRPYEALLLGPWDEAETGGPRPALLLMTQLPIVWGAGGAFDPNSRPAETYKALEREFAVAPLDALEPRSLTGGRLILIAQPRLLAPEELVALDDWVRSGGRVLVLTDPHLAAAERMEAGNVARPPLAGLLAPLLRHWGLRLDPRPPGARPAFVAGRRLGLDSPGWFAVSGTACRIVGAAWMARCRIGRGEALLVADADLLTDESWAPGGSARHLRTADNPLIVADWLDGLAGVRRARIGRHVDWIRPGTDIRAALLLAALPLALALVAGLALLRRARRSPTSLSTGTSTENSARTNDLQDP